MPWWDKALAEGLIDEQGHIVYGKEATPDQTKEATSPNDKSEPSQKTKDSLHSIIGVLLDIVMNDSAQGFDISSETKLRNFMKEQYEGLSGISLGNTGDVFSKAKKLLKEKDLWSKP